MFIGPELCRDPEWLRLSTEYPIEAFTAVQTLHQWPPFLHNYIHWFLPSARKLRMRQSQASTILLPIVEKRREADEAARREGKQSESEFNLLDIVDEYCRKDGDYSPVISQLGFSFAAVHSTSDLISKTILDLCRHPEMIKPLRQEIITVIGQEGWQKSGVLKLKLLDSVLKETQRMSPVSTCEWQTPYPSITQHIFSHLMKLFEKCQCDARRPQISSSKTGPRFPKVPF